MTYAANYLATYHEIHRRERFAGNLIGAGENRSPGGQPGRRASLEDILDSLVLPNGVRKTTVAGRQRDTLRHFLNRPERPVEGARIRVLDLPCSSGVASIESYNLLCGHYEITSYVLADLCLEVKYDRQRDAVYDPTGRLLQVQRAENFFSIYRPHASSRECTFLSDLLLWPISVRSRLLRRQCALEEAQDLETVRLLHPEAERRVGQGIFSVRNADVFDLGWKEEFELIMTFNLLQKNYFPPAKIAEGLESLGRVLTEGGYLITGNTESFGVMRRTNGVLVSQYRQGQW